MTVTIDELEIAGLEIAGLEIAYALTRSNGTQTVITTGTDPAESNRGALVDRRQSDLWKITRYMFNKPSDPGHRHVFSRPIRSRAHGANGNRGASSTSTSLSPPEANWIDIARPEHRKTKPSTRSGTSERPAPALRCAGLSAHISDGAGEIGWTLPDGDIERLNRHPSASTSGQWPLGTAG